MHRFAHRHGTLNERHGGTVNVLNDRVVELSRWLKSESRAPIACIMGMTNSGKSTVVMKLSSFGFAVVQPGKVIRQSLITGSMKSPKGTIGMDVPEWDDMVIDVVFQAVDSNPISNVIVDGFPRNYRQLAMVLGKGNVTGRQVRIVHVDATEEVRSRRAREGGEEWDRKNFVTRNDDELKRFPTLLALARKAVG